MSRDDLLHLNDEIMQTVTEPVMRYSPSAVLACPSSLGRGGAEEVIEIRLAQHEREALARSAAAVTSLTSVMGV